LMNERTDLGLSSIMLALNSAQRLLSVRISLLDV